MNSSVFGSQSSEVTNIEAGFGVVCNFITHSFRFKGIHMLYTNWMQDVFQGICWHMFVTNNDLKEQSEGQDPGRKIVTMSTKWARLGKHSHDTPWKQPGLWLDT